MMPRQTAALSRRGSAGLALVFVVLWAAVPAHGKTIVLAARDGDRFAAITATAPRMSLALHEESTGFFHHNRVHVTRGRSFLIRYPLDQIPAGQRITHAEWVLPVTSYGGTEPRFYAWRMLAEWGPGVCHRYRLTIPDTIEWIRPGAGGRSSDRATVPSDIVRLTEAGERVINVTEDLELWYTKSAPNNGWLLTVEDPDVEVFLASPLWSDGVDRWQLRITFEPE